jgi:hypothetical protein
MRKLYKATKISTIVFVSDKTDKKELFTEAQNWFEQEKSTNGDDPVAGEFARTDISELNSLKNLPDRWAPESCIWGIQASDNFPDQHFVTCSQWFDEQKITRIEILKQEIVRLNEELHSLTTNTN